MKDRLSYKQLFEELENLNITAYSSLLDDDFDGFQEAIEKFIASGITGQEEFPAARAAYRFSSMPFTLDGMWIGTDGKNPMDDHICAISGLFISDLKQRDTYPFYACLTEQEKIERAENKLVGKRMAALEEYKELYKALYGNGQSVNMHIFTAPLVSDIEKHQMGYISRVTELAAARSRFHLSYDFSCSLIDNEYLKKLPIPEKMKYLTRKFANLYDQTTHKHVKNIADYFTCEDSNMKILASNYLQGKGIDRKNWKKYTKGALPGLPLFYLELAFYLAIPSSDEIEKFMNLHGYSIKSPMTLFHDVCGGKYHILHKDLCRWIDAGIDYNLINEMCGYQLEQKETRKQKAE